METTQTLDNPNAQIGLIIQPNQVEYKLAIWVFSYNIRLIPWLNELTCEMWLNRWNINLNNGFTKINKHNKDRPIRTEGSSFLRIFYVAQLHHYIERISNWYFDI